MEKDESDECEVHDMDEEDDFYLQEDADFEDGNEPVGDDEEDGEGQSESNNEDEEDDEDYQPTNPLHYTLLSLFTGFSSRHSSNEPTPTPPPPPASLLEERIADDITSSTRVFPDTAPRPITSMLLQREIYRKCPFSHHDQIHIAHRQLPTRGRMMFDYDHQVFCGQFSRDGSVYMSAAQDRRVRLYNTQTWRPIKEIFARHIGWSVIDLDYSPDQRWVIYSSWSDYVHICNLQGDFEIHDALDFRPDADRFCLFSIKFSPNSAEILGGSSDRNLYIYDIDRKDRVLQTPAHNDDINTVCFLDETGNLLASGSDDHLIKVWDRRIMGSGGSSSSTTTSSRTSSRVGSGCVGVFAGHLEGITHLSPKGDGRYLISNGKDQCIKLWDVRSMLTPGSKIQQPSSSRWDYRFGEMGNPSRLFSGAHPNDKSIQTYRGHKVFQTLIRAYFSPQSTTGQKYIYTGSYDGCIYIYDVLTAKLVKKLSGHSAIVRDLSWHPFDTQIVSTSWDGTVWNWNTDELEPGEEPEARPQRRRFRRYYDEE